MQVPKVKVGKLRATMKIVKNARGWQDDWVAEYGDPFQASAMNGDVVVTGRPDLIKQLLQLKSDDVAPFATSAIGGILGRSSLLTIEGEQHRRQRKLLMPPFQGDRMRAYADTMVAATRHHMPQAGTFEVGDFARAVTLDIISRAVFGFNTDEDIEEGSRLLEAQMKAAKPILMFTDRLHKDFFGLGPYAKFIRAKEASDTFMLAHVNKLREDVGNSGDSILALMLAARYDDGQPMSDEEILDQMRTLLAAGHETSAIILMWAADYIARDTDLQERLRTDILAAGDGPEAWAGVPLLKATIDETLRLHPPGPEVFRELKKPIKLGEYDIPAGISVSMSAEMAHLNPDTYPDPHAFKPERFVDKTYPPHVFFPFGGGVRRCIGAAFAHYEMRIVIAMLLQKFRLTPAAQKPTIVRRNITVGPSTEVPLVAKNI